MKIVGAVCPQCGANLKIDAEHEKAFCEHCGAELLLQDEVPHIQYDNAEQAGYAFERGRQRALYEAQNMQNSGYYYSSQTQQLPKRRTWLWVLGWIFFFPAPVMVLIWRKKNTWDVKIKIAVTALFWILLFSAGQINGRNSNTGSYTERHNVSVTDNRSLDTTSTNDNQSVAVDNRYNDSITVNEEPSVSVSESDFDVKGYLYEQKSGSKISYSIYYLIITNHSPAAVRISGNATAKDSAGNSIGADSTNVEVLGPEETTITQFFFDGVGGIEKVDYQLSYDTNTYFYPVLSNLDLKQTMNDTNVTITLTNNGTTAAEFVEAYALFFNADNELIHTDLTYVTDSDGEIKPGASRSAQLDLSKGNYDHVEVYLKGTASEDSAMNQQTAANVTDSDFDIKEYLFESSYGTTQDFLVIKNNSAETVEISGNGTAYDSKGNAVGAANLSIDVLGPGETSIGYFYFNKVSGVDKVDYDLQYSKESSIKPVLSNLNIQQTLNNNNIVISITNNGNIPAQFVQANALFFDSGNNIVDTYTTYVIDDDNEIKPDATLSAQINTYDENYDHVELYFTGRAYTP